MTCTPFKNVSLLGVPNPVTAVTLSPVAVVLVTLVTTWTFPVPLVVSVASFTVGWVIVKVASLPITVSVVLSKVTFVTISVKSIWVSPSFSQFLLPAGPTGTYSQVEYKSFLQNLLYEFHF